VVMHAISYVRHRFPPLSVPITTSGNIHDEVCRESVVE
jgi:hypothetical protein